MMCAKIVSTTVVCLHWLKQTLVERSQHHFQTLDVAVFTGQRYNAVPKSSVKKTVLT